MKCTSWIEAVERVADDACKVNHRGEISARPYPVFGTMLALLNLFLCQRDLLEPADRAHDAPNDIGVRFVAAMSIPTMARSRPSCGADNLAAFGESFLQLLLLAKELKSLQGTGLSASTAASSRPLRASTVR